MEMIKIIVWFCAEWSADSLRNLKVENGYIKVPDKLGVGVDIDLEVIEEHPYKPVDLHKTYKEDCSIMEW